MATSTAELVYANVRKLPEPRQREVLDFVGYLLLQSEHAAVADLENAQESVLAGVWDNPEDEAWDAP